MASENGWEPSHAPADLLEWVTVPGTDVHLQFMKGWPSTVMRAYAADYHAYIEPLRDADSASFTPTNSVATSNHLNGTAMDLNWNSHPFRVDYAGFDPPKIARMRELLAFYNFEGLQIMFWAQDWDNPKDAMHHQMGYNTWNNPKVLRFIQQRIRPDGFSTYKRGGTIPPPPPPQLSRADRYALLIIAEGRRRGITPRGIQIALATALVESNITVYANAKVPASMNIPHDAVGSDGYSVGIFQQQVRDTGNGWWWGDAATCMDPTSSAGLFYDRLARLPYNGPNSPGSYAQAVQQSAFPDRYDQRFGEAVDLYNRLAGTAPPPPPPPPGEDDWLNMPSNQEKLDAIYNAFFMPQPPENIYREASETVGQNLVDSIRSTVSMVYEGTVERLALVGEKASQDKVVRVARGLGPESRQWAIDRAKLIWAKGLAGSGTAAALPADAAGAAIQSATPAAPDRLTAELAAAYTEIGRLRELTARLQEQAAQAPPVSTEVAVVEPAKTSGDHAKDLINSVDDWTAHALTMNPQQQHALSAASKILLMKNGTEL